MTPEYVVCEATTACRTDPAHLRVHPAGEPLRFQAGQLSGAALCGTSLAGGADVETTPAATALTWNDALPPGALGRLCTTCVDHVFAAHLAAGTHSISKG